MSVCLESNFSTSEHPVYRPAQSSGYRWVAADWYPVWRGQLSEPAGPLGWTSAAPAGHQAIAGSQHRETHPGRSGSLPAICGSRSVGNQYNLTSSPPDDIHFLCDPAINILSIFAPRWKLAPPQTTPKSERKNVGGASNRAVQWGFPKDRVWGGDCDPVAIPLWGGYV